MMDFEPQRTPADSPDDDPGMQELDAFEAELRSFRMEVTDLDAAEACLHRPELVQLLSHYKTLIPDELSGTVTFVPRDHKSFSELPTEIGPYRVIRPLGRGGMGVVLLARHQMLGTQRAIKLISPELARSGGAVARFRSEIRAQGQVSGIHPAFAEAMEAHEVDGLLYLVTESISGVDLERLLRHTGPLPVPVACEIIRQAAAAMAAAHAHGLVHRDLKPSNLMLSPGGTVRVLDLGLALLTAGLMDDDIASPETFGDAGDTAGDFTPTTTEAPINPHSAVEPSVTVSRSPAPGARLLGTLEYMAPEQLADPDAVDFHCDVYSLGATLFALLTGRSPLNAERNADRQVKIDALARHDLRDIRAAGIELPEELCRLIERLLGRASAQRSLAASGLPAELKKFSSFEQTRDLTELLPVSSPVADWPAATSVFAELQRRQQQRRQRRRHRRLGIGGALALTAAAAISTVLPHISSMLIAWSESEDSRQPVVLSLQDTEPPRAVVPFDVNQAQQYQQQWADNQRIPVTRTNSIGMELQLIPPGEFNMGTIVNTVIEFIRQLPPLDDSTRNALTDHLWSESPMHTAWIDDPFYMGRHEVTVDQFRQFVSETGYVTEPESTGRGAGSWSGGTWTRNNNWIWSANSGIEQTGQHPVLCVTWNDANAFCAWLSQKEGVTYSLPTEAEWEYACRAGNTSSEVESQLDQLAWHTDNSGKQSHPVGQLKANAFGLCDMYGNCYEWCHSILRSYGDPDPQKDRLLNRQGYTRAMRGGAYNSHFPQVRAAYRIGAPSDLAYNNVGFRVVQRLFPCEEIERDDARLTLSGESAQEAAPREPTATLPAKWTPEAFQAVDIGQVEEPPPLNTWLADKQIITVKQDGTADFRTIGEAVRVVKAGQVIEVLDVGPYRETITRSDFPGRSGLISRAGTVIIPSHWHAVTESSVSPVAHTITSGSDVRFSGLNFHSASRPGRCPFALNVAGTIVIEDCAFMQSGRTRIGDQSGPPTMLIGEARSKDALEPLQIVFRDCVIGPRFIIRSGTNHALPSTVLVTRNLLRTLDDHARLQLNLNPEKATQARVHVVSNVFDCPHWPLAVILTSPEWVTRHADLFIDRNTIHSRTGDRMLPIWGSGDSRTDWSFFCTRNVVSAPETLWTTNRFPLASGVRFNLVPGHHPDLDALEEFTCLTKLPESLAERDYMRLTGDLLAYQLLRERGGACIPGAVSPHEPNRPDDWLDVLTERCRQQERLHLELEDLVPAEPLPAVDAPTSQSGIVPK